MSDDTTLDVNINARTTGESGVAALATQLAGLAARVQGLAGASAAQVKAFSAVEKATARVAAQSTSASKAQQAYTGQVTRFSGASSKATLAVRGLSNTFNQLNKSQTAVAKSGTSVLGQSAVQSYKAQTRAAEQYATAVKKVTAVTGNAARYSALGTNGTASATPVSGLSLSGAGLGAKGTALVAAQAKNATKGMQQLTLQTKAAGDQGALLNKQFALTSLGYLATKLGKELLGIGVAAFKVSADYQAAFANVQRTTQTSGQEAQKLKQALIDLSTEVPHTFDDIADVAALGGQLGVASGNIVDFTKTVTKLKLTTDLTYEAAGTAIGRISQLLKVPSSQYENLASSILKVGINSVATESQIVKTANNLASIGNLAGLSAPQVIGLSGALQSLGVPPELSRGTFEQFFTKMANAAADGGDSLDTFARISGLSAKEFAANYNSGNSAKVQKNVTAFFEGLGKSGKDARNNLKDLGIISVRYVPTLLKLAQNTQVYNKALKDATDGYVQNVELAKQYATRTDTVNAKIIILGNTLKKAFEAVGSKALAPLGKVLDAVSGIVAAFGDFASTGVGSVILTIGAGIAALAGAALIAIGGLGTLAGSLLAIRVAVAAFTPQLATLAETTAALGATELGAAGAVDIFSASALIATASVGRLSQAELASLATSAAVAAGHEAAAAGASAEAIATSQAAAANAVYSRAAGTSVAGKAVTRFSAAGAGLATFATSLGGVALGLGVGLTALSLYSVRTQQLGIDAAIAAAGVGKLTAATKKNKQATPEQLVKTAKIDTSAITKSQRTVDLGNQVGADQNQQAQGRKASAIIEAARKEYKTIDTQLASMAQNGGVQSAQKAFADLSTQVGASYSDFPKFQKAVSDYNAALNIANGTTQVTATTTDGAKKAYDNLVKAVNDASKAIAGYADSSNQSTDATSAYYQALDDTTKAANESGKAALNAAGGFALTTQSGRDASGALRDLADKGNALAGQMFNLGEPLSKVKAQTEGTQAAVRKLGAQFGLSGAALDDFVQTYVASPKEIAYQAKVSGLGDMQAQVDSFVNRNDGRTIRINTTNTIATITGRGKAASSDPNGAGFASGGYTGRGSKNEVAGIVHRGEVVFEQDAVKSIGLGNLMSLRNNGAMPQASQRAATTSASRGGGNSGYVTISPAQITQLANALTVNVAIGNKQVANATNAATLTAAQRGAGG